MATSFRETAGSARNRTFDAMRLVFAYMVLEDHSYDLTGTWSSEILRAPTRGMGMGGIALIGFFLLSGYLIVASWVKDPSPGDFLAKRALRILPGYIVALTLSVVICGWIAPQIPRYFHTLIHGHAREIFIRSTVMMDSPAVPPIFPGLPWQSANGSLWSLQYESRAYILVGLFGVLGLIRHRYAWLGATVALALLIEFPIHPLFYFALYRYAIIDAASAPRLLFPFFVGGCFYLYRDRIRFGPVWDCLAVLAIVGSFARRTVLYELFIVAFSYLLFRVAALPVSYRGWFARVPDISYGVYIYGYLVQQVLVWYFHPTVAVLMPLSFIGATGMGLLSWYLVEKPMLKLKPRPSVPADPQTDRVLSGSQATV